MTYKKNGKEVSEEKKRENKASFFHSSPDSSKSFLDLHVVVGEVTDLTVQASLQPVVIDLAQQHDHIAFPESQFSFVLRIKVVQGYTERVATVRAGSGLLKES